MARTPASKTGSASAKKASAKKASAKKATTAKSTKSATKAAPTKAAAKSASKDSTTKKAATKKAAPAKAAAKKATKQPAAKKASAKKAASLDKFTIQQRELLLAERQDHLDQAEAYKAEADRLAQEMEPGDADFGEEGGEGGTLSVDRERDLLLSAQARAVIEDIDDALAKIDAGTYGICESCGKPIVKDRLRAIPHARLCVACKTGGLSRR